LLHDFRATRETGYLDGIAHEGARSALDDAHELSFMKTLHPRFGNPHLINPELLVIE
jgi:hypothetical protein